MTRSERNHGTSLKIQTCDDHGRLGPPRSNATARDAVLLNDFDSSSTDVATHSDMHQHIGGLMMD